MQVLQEDKGNLKALFRRGKAYNGMGHTEEALRDLQAAAKVAPTDRAISRETHALRAAMKHDREVGAPALVARHAGMTKLSAQGINTVACVAEITTRKWACRRRQSSSKGHSTQQMQR